MSIKKKSGSYEVRVGVRRKDGKGMVCRQRQNIPNLRDAERIERELHQDCFMLAKGYKPDSRWPAVVEMYLTDAEVIGRLSPATLHQYRIHLNAHTLSVWSRRDINDISTSDVLDLITSNAKHFAWKTSHQRFIKKTISVVFGYACSNGLCRHNPCHALHIKTEERSYPTWNQDQVKTFLRLAKDSNSEWYYCWAMAIYTGLRSAELRALAWSHIDLKTKIIRVDQSWSPRSGVKAPKNRKARVVPINAPLKELLRELQIKSAFSNEDFVLPRLTSWDNGDQSKELRKFLRTTDLPLITFHTLRSIFASQCLLAGMPLHLLKQICGWSNLTSAERYLRVSGADLIGSTDSLDFTNESNSQPGTIIPFRGRTKSRP